MSDRLYSDSVRTMPRGMDWSEDRFGPDGDERWTSYEGFKCETEGCPFVVVSTGGEVRCDEDSGTLYLNGQRYDPDDAEEGDPVPCGEYIGHAEGPMMNYAYAVDRADSDSAARLTDLPLALVETDDGDWFLALTGGGMDLSWEICAGYVRLGSYPPAHFASNLPRIGSMGNDRAEWYAETVAAARESLTLVASWSERDRAEFVGKYGPAESV